MESGLSFLDEVKKQFDCEDMDIRTYSPLTLAFLGDCVYDLIIRTVVVCRKNRATNDLHKKKSKVVKAETQARMIEALMEHLTEEELGYFKRGRNAKSYTPAKNASLGDYKKSTGFEALIGFLYLTNQMDRILELTTLGLELVNVEI